MHHVYVQKCSEMFIDNFEIHCKVNCEVEIRYLICYDISYER